VTSQSHIVICPFCQARYRAPRHLEGKTVICKTCGKKFPLAFESGDPSPAQGTPKVNPPSAASTISAADSLLVLGKLAVKFKYITDEQLSEALAVKEQKSAAGETCHFGQILVDLDMLTVNQRDFLLSVQQMRETRTLDQRFGELALSNGFVSREALGKALDTQKQSFLESKKVLAVGDILVRQGSLTENQRDALLKLQNRLKVPENSSSQPAPSPAERTKEGEENQTIRLEVSEDGMLATLSFSSSRPVPQVTLDQVKTLLVSKGICSGIKGDKEIQRYLERLPDFTQPWPVAQGSPPKDIGVSKVVFHFDTDPLKIEGYKQGGTMNFTAGRAGGLLKSGDCVAELEGGETEYYGTDVYGKKIPPAQKPDVSFLCGTGCGVSDDGRKVLATADGFPERSAYGRLFVFPLIHLKEEFDCENTPIDVEGRMEFAGTIPDKCVLQCGSLISKEILKADIRALGDVVVTGGIIGATIHTDGNVRCRYVHQASIFALGDVVVEQEIIDSDIESGGALLIREGDILNSRIAAYTGVEVMDVGSDKANPSVINISDNSACEKKIEARGREIEALKEERITLEETVQQLRNQSKAIEGEIGALAQTQDRTMVAQRKSAALVRSLGETGGSRDKQIEAQMEEQRLGAKIANIEKTLENRLEQQDVIVEQIARAQKEIRNINARVDAIQADLKAVEQWAFRKIPPAVLTVQGTIYTQNIVAGPDSSLTLDTSRKHVFFKEERHFGGGRKIAISVIEDDDSESSD